MAKNKICPVCGKPYEFKLEVFYENGKPVSCLHDTRVPFVSEDAKQKKKLIKREALLKAHYNKKLSKSWYSRDKNGQLYLSPKKLYKEFGP